MPRPDPLTFAGMSPHDPAVLLASARELQRAAVAQATPPRLGGKYLALLSDADPDADPDAALFRQAALELGARVAHVRPDRAHFGTRPDIRHIAWMLGRLYDAVECQGLPAALVQRLSHEAAIPVFDGLASARHPSAPLADLLDADTPAADRRRFVLQAVLLTTVE